MRAPKGKEKGVDPFARRHRLTKRSATARFIFSL
jgi:hypothetical protein